MSLIMPMRVTAETNSAVTNLDKVSAAERRVGAEARVAGQQMQQGFGQGNAAAKTLLTTVESLQQGLFRVTAAFGVTAVITQFTRGIVDSSNKMQGWRQAFNAATASTVKGAQELEFARAEAERLGISLESSTYSFAKLTASTRGTILAGEGTREIFTAIAEASRVLNLGAEQTTGAFRAIEQMISKGNVQAEELRGQLAERIPGAFALTAQAMGVTTEELNGMLERGEVLASDMLPKLAAELKKLYSGAAADAANTPAASFARLGNAILELQVAIGNAGFMKILADGAKDLTDALRDLVASGAISTIFEGLVLIGKGAVLAFGGKVLAVIGEYAKSQYTATFATQVLTEQQFLAGKQALKTADELVFVTRAREGELLVERESLASKIRLLQAQIALDKANLAKPVKVAEMSQIAAALEARRIATEQLAASEARLIALNVEASAIAKLRIVAENQTTAALEAQRLAQVGLIAPMTTTAAVMTKLAGIGRTLFAAIGGWPTIILAAGYALYSLWTAMDAGDEKHKKLIENVDEYIAKLEEQIRVQKLVDSGRATPGTVEAVTKFDELKKEVREYQEKIQNANAALKELNELRNAADRGPVLFNTAVIENATEALGEAQSRLQNLVNLTIQLGGEVPAEFKSMSNAAKDFGDKLKDIGTDVANYIEKISTISKGEVEFNNSLIDKAEKLKIANIEQEKGLKAALMYEAATKRAQELNISYTLALATLDQATLNHINTVSDLTAQNEALVESENARDKAEKDAEKNQRKRAEASSEFIAKLQEEVSAYALTDAAKLELEATSLGLNAAQSKEVASLLKLKALHDATAPAIRKSEAAFNDLVEENQNLDEIIAQNKDTLAGFTKEQVRANAATRKANTLLEQAIALGPNAAAAMKLYEEQLTKIALIGNQEIQIKLDEDAFQESVDKIKEDADRLKDLLADNAKSGMRGIADDIRLIGEEIKKALDRGEDVTDLKNVMGDLRQEMLVGMVGAAQSALGAIQGLATEGSSAYRALGIAQQALNLVMAIGAIANQGMGDPYTAFARIAAMAAAMAGLVGSLGGFSGGGSQSAEAMQESQGTGTVLGDTEAKSESMANAIEITADATSELVGINRGMLRALQSMQAGISGAVTSIAGSPQAELALAGARSFDTTGTGYDLGGMILSSILGGSQQLVDRGISIAGGAFGNVSQNPNAATYQTIETDGGWFHSDDTNVQSSALSASAAAQISLVLTAIGDAVREGAEALGMDMEAVNAAIEEYRVAEIRISTMDLSGEEAQAELEAVFSSIFDGLAGSVVPFIGQFQQVGEGLGETLIRVATGVQVTQEALYRLGFDLEETGPEAFAQMSESLIGFVGGIEEFISGMQSFVDKFAPESFKFEILQSDLTRALEQVGLAVPETRDGMWELMQSLDATTESGREQIAALLRLSGTADAYYSHLEDASENVVDAAAELAERTARFTQSIADAVFEQEATPFEQAMQAIRRSTASYIRDANVLARARGDEGARTQDLALIHRWAANEVKKAIAQLEGSIRGLIDQLGYGPLATLEQQILALEGSMNTDGQLDGLGDVGAAAEDLFAQWEDGIESLRKYSESLLIGDLSPLSKEEQLAEARRQLDAALAAAQGGDINALNSLPQLADQFFGQLRDWEASGIDYSGVVQQYLDQFNALGANPYSPLGQGGGPTSVPLVPSEELLALYAQRDLMAAEQEAARRLALALELASYLEELARATGETVFEAAERLGVNFAQFVTDLGGDIGAETAEAVAALGDVANTLSVELPELADRLGLALGELTDTQSLLNDAFELELDGLPTEFRDQLEPLLRAVEVASSPEETNTALDELNEATNALPEEFRLQLAPYLTNVDPITPDLANELDYLSDIYDNSDAANALLTEIRNELILARGGVPPESQGVSSVSPKTNQFAGDTLTAVRSANAENNVLMIAEFQAMRAEMEKTRLELKMALDSLERSNTQANKESANQVSSSVDNLARTGIVTRMG